MKKYKMELPVKMLSHCQIAKFANHQIISVSLRSEKGILAETLQ
jgi:hypothetical protein